MTVTRVVTYQKFVYDAESNTYVPGETYDDTFTEDRNLTPEDAVALFECPTDEPDNEIPVEEPVTECFDGQILAEDMNCVPGNYYENPEEAPALNPDAVTGGTAESVAALPPEQRSFVESYAKKHGIAPEDVLIEMG